MFNVKNLTLVALLSASTMYGSVEQIDELKSKELTLAKAISYLIEDFGKRPTKINQIVTRDYLPKGFEDNNVFTTKELDFKIINDDSIEINTNINTNRISEEDKNRYLTPVKKSDFYIKSSIKNNTLVTTYKLTDRARNTLLNWDYFPRGYFKYLGALDPTTYENVRNGEVWLDGSEKLFKLKIYSNQSWEKYIKKGIGNAN